MDDNYVIRRRVPGTDPPVYVDYVFSAADPTRAPAPVEHVHGASKRDMMRAMRSARAALRTDLRRRGLLTPELERKFRQC